MKIYLVRHGIAVQNTGGSIISDAQRPLTEEGLAQTRKVAHGIRRICNRPGLILTSPLTRAYQTAEILADVFSSHHVLHKLEALAPGGGASNVYKFLSNHESVTDIFLVGHQPDISRLAANMLWADQELDMPFKKAAVCRIDISSAPPTAPGTLKWFITPEIALHLAATEFNQ